MTATSESFIVRALERAASATCAVLSGISWGAGVALFAAHVGRVVLMPTAVFDVAEAFLLALAALTLQAAAFRVEVDDFDRAWTYSLESDSLPASPYAARWRTYGWVGLASLGAAVAIAACILTGMWRDRSNSDRLIALIFALAPAVQCTLVGVVGPLLAHIADERVAAREAYWRIKASAQAAAVQTEKG